MFSCLSCYYCNATLATGNPCVSVFLLPHIHMALGRLVLCSQTISRHIQVKVGKVLGYFIYQLCAKVAEPTFVHIIIGKI